MSLLKCFSLFIDIGREDWTCGCSRSITSYINNFVSFYSTLEVDLTLFCEENFKNFLEPIISNHENFRSKIRFELINRSDLRYFSSLQEIESIQKSESLKQAIKNSSTNVPEYNRPDYVALMFSKPEILLIAKNRRLINDDDQVAWIDFGIAHGKQQYISILANKSLVTREFLNDKVVLFNRKSSFPPNDVESFFNMSDNVFVPGGFFVVPGRLVDDFCADFNSTVESQLFKKCLVDDDQTVLSIVANNKNLCSVIDSSKWFNNPPGGDWFPVFDFID